MKKLLLGATILFGTFIVTPAFAWRMPTGASLGAQVTSTPSPLTPTGIIVTTTPKFTWTAVAGASSYSLTVLKGTATVFTKTGLTGTSWTTPSANAFPAGSSYTWKVKAGNGAWSNILYFALQLPAPTPLSPSGNITATRPTFTWTAVNGAVSYNVQVIDNTNPALSITAIEATSTTSWPLPGFLPALIPGHLYSWTVQGYSNGLGGIQSTSMPFYVLNDFSIGLQLLTPVSTTVNTTTPTFTWTGSATETYKLQLMDMNTATSLSQNNVTGTSWTPTAAQALTVGHTYAWMVLTTTTPILRSTVGSFTIAP